MFNIATQEALGTLDVEFVPLASPSPMLDFLNRLSLAVRKEATARYVGYAYEFDAREPDYLIFSVTRAGERREYMVPVTHEWGWNGSTPVYTGSTLFLSNVKSVITRPQYPDADAAIFAPHIGWDEEVPLAARTAILEFVRAQQVEGSDYKLRCAREVRNGMTLI